MGNSSPFINLFRHDDFLLQFAMLPNGGRLLSNSMRVSTSSSFLYLFLFIINWCAFGFYLVLRLSPLEKDYRGLEYQCLFVRLYLFLFAFLIICIETSCIFDYLYWDFWFFVDFFVTLPSSFAKTGPQSDIQVSGISEDQQRKNYLQKV